MMNYLERYLAGDCVGVWSELRELGPEIYDPPVVVQVNLVARELTRRVKENIDVLVERLNTLGYQFGKNHLGEDDLAAAPFPVGPGDGHIGFRVDRFQSAIGVLPLVLCEFWKTVGWVDFTGFHVSLAENTDPLVVYPFDVVGNEGQWFNNFGQGNRESFIPVAPDYWQKHHYSGDNWTIRLPANTLDGLMSNGAEEIYFVEYLRAYLRNGGFSGDAKAQQQPISFARKLAQGLLPF